MAFEQNIKFIGNRIDREKSLKFVDKIVKGIDGIEGFSKGIDLLSHDYKIQISDDDDSFSVVMESLTNNSAILDFIIDKASGAVYRPDGTKNFKKGGEDDVDFLDEV